LGGVDRRIEPAAAQRSPCRGYGTIVVRPSRPRRKRMRVGWPEKAPANESRTLPPEPLAKQEPGKQRPSYESCGSFAIGDTKSNYISLFALPLRYSDTSSAGIPARENRLQPLLEIRLCSADQKPLSGRRCALDDFTARQEGDVRMFDFASNPSRARKAQRTRASPVG
jgi:hypothetical protein